MIPWKSALQPLGWIRRQVFLLRDRKRELHAALSLIADELHYNAHILGRYEGLKDMHGLMSNLRFEAYDRHALTAVALERKNPELWREVADVYGALRRTHATGSIPPFDSTYVHALNQRVRGARY